MHANQKSWLKWQELVGPSRPGGSRGAPAPKLPAREDLEALTSPQALAANAPSRELVHTYKSCVGDAGWYCNRTRKDLMPAYRPVMAAH